MDVTITVTEDSSGWGPVRVPEPDGVLLQAGEGWWVVDNPDGIRCFWRMKILPGTTKP
jgi:hypothetical protein